MLFTRCIVVPITLQDHPTAAHLQIGKVGDHEVVVGRHYDNGTLGFYIPVGAIVPDQLLEDMWLKGKLAGAKRNRVKSRTMYGVKSDGLFYGSRYWVLQDGLKTYFDSRNWQPHWRPGDDITDQLGIVLGGG